MTRGALKSEIRESRGLAEKLGGIADPLSLLTGLFAHAHAAFQIYRPSGQCLLVNQAFVDLFGSEPPPEYNILEDEIAERQGQLPFIRRALAGETVHVPAFWYDARELAKVEGKEGRRVAVEATMFPLFDANHVIDHIAISFKDVTARMELEAEIEIATEKEQRNLRNLEATRSKSRLLPSISHELRTPLNAIIGFAELMLNGQVDPASPQHREFLGDILTSGKQLVRLINDVDDLAKAEAGTSQSRPWPLDPGR